MRSRSQNCQDIVKRSTINYSVFCCACIIVRISDDFIDDRHENRLVEVRLKGYESNAKVKASCESNRKLLTCKRM